jgi:hypothetical protein
VSAASRKLHHRCAAGALLRNSSLPRRHILTRGADPQRRRPASAVPSSSAQSPRRRCCSCMAAVSTAHRDCMPVPQQICAPPSRSAERERDCQVTLKHRTEHAQAEHSGPRGPRDSFVFDVHSPPQERTRHESTAQAVQQAHAHTTDSLARREGNAATTVRAQQSQRHDKATDAQATGQCGCPAQATVFSEGSPDAQLGQGSQLSSSKQQVVDSLELALAKLEQDVANRRSSRKLQSGHVASTVSTSIDSLAALEAEIAAQHCRLQSIGEPETTHDDEKRQAGQPTACHVQGTDVYSNASSTCLNSIAVHAHDATPRHHERLDIPMAPASWQCGSQTTSWTARMGASSSGDDWSLTSSFRPRVLHDACSSERDSHYDTGVTSVTDSLCNLTISVCCKFPVYIGPQREQMVASE